MPNLGIAPGDYPILKQRIDEICQRLGIAPALVDIDTLRRTMPGKDENSAKDMGVVIDNCGKLAQDFGCLVSVNHHSPRSDDTRGSGTNALEAAADVVWSCIRQGVERKATASLAYMKDGPDAGIAWEFGLRDFPMIGPKGGKLFTPCVVHILSGPATPTATDTERTRPKAVRLPVSAKTALRALRQAIAELGTVPPASNHIPANVRTVTVGQWRDYAYRNGISDGEQRAKEKAFKRAFERLIDDEMVIAWNDAVWLPSKQEREKNHES
jgi:AAA domain